MEEKFNFKIGDLVTVKQKIVEAGRQRWQNFEGIVIAKRGRGENQTFTVRKIASSQVAVERIFPVSSPWVLEVKVKKKGKVRRAKLYYLREKKSSKTKTS